MSTRDRSPQRRVGTLRVLSVILAVAAVLGLVFGTAGFSAMTADRGLEANVTDDENAYLGYEAVTDTVDSNASTPVVEYRNRFDDDIDEFHVDVSLVNHGDTRVTLEAVDSPDSLDEGTAGSVDVTLSCPDEEEIAIRLAVDASGSGVSVSFERVHTVTCVPDGAAAAGNGSD